ncbi:hypothetical protein B296_00011333 [Ensete ventricosum]|uniref:Uncharacterized protein n=1 Tax=Ensete ventricosum TaxID=4639 RepID=A0A426XIF4_ENSVE|nr:hypothetical protein B296_00011333 [Ensete ventricosum]
MGEGPSDLEPSCGVIRTSTWSSIARLLVGSKSARLSCNHRTSWGKRSVEVKSSLEGMVGNVSPRMRLRARLAMIDTESPWTRLRARLEMLGTESPWARLRARLEVLGTKSAWVRLRARLEMLGTESPWARLRARLEVLGTKSAWVRLKAHLEMLGTESPWARFNLGKMKSDGETGNKSTIPSTTSAFTTVGVAGSMAEKRPSVGEGASLRKHIRKAAFGSLQMPLGAPRGPLLKRGRGGGDCRGPRMGVHHPGSMRGGSTPHPCKVANKELKLRANQELVAASEHRVKELEDKAKEAEGPKAMTNYKVSRGFESGLEKIGRVSYEFGYRVVLERL